MSHFNAIWKFLGHQRYAIVFVFGFLFVGVIGENSYATRFGLDAKISDLKDEINDYKARDAKVKKVLLELRDNPAAIEKIARERYFMKADDEDIYVLSDDQSDSKTQKQTETNETTE